MESKRLHYIDWLRVLAVLSLIPFHAALTYQRYGVVPIKAPVSGLSALPFLIVSVPLGDFFMTLLFFVSGVASFYSFQKRNTGMYIGERARKLMLPFLFGFLLLCPATAYLQGLYEGFEGGFLNFLPQFFWNQIFHYNGYMHLWFLLYLFAFSALCLPLFSWWKKDESRLIRIRDFLTKGQRLLLPFGMIILFELLLRTFFHPDAYIIIFDWANDAVYLSVFILGYLFAADERIQEKLKKYYKLSVILGVLSLGTLFYVNIQSQVFYSNEAYLTLLWTFGKGIYECSAIVFLMNFGRDFLNKGGKTITYLNKASFSIYILHYLPVTFFTFLFMDLKMHIVIKFLLVVILSYSTIFLAYELWRRTSSLLGRLKAKK